jgi:hypothetical protein
MKELERFSSYDHSDSERKADPFASTILGCGLDDKAFDFLFLCADQEGDGGGCRLGYTCHRSSCHRGPRMHAFASVPAYRRRRFVLVFARLAVDFFLGGVVSRFDCQSPKVAPVGSLMMLSQPYCPATMTSR